MGVYWAKSAADKFPGQVEIVDLRTIHPLDEEIIFESVNKHNRCLVVSEEPKENSFAQALAGKIQENCFSNLGCTGDSGWGGECTGYSFKLNLRRTVSTKCGKSG